MRNVIIQFAYITAVLAFLGLAGCDGHAQESPTLKDKPIAAFRTQLLDTAFGLASAISINPHLKDRSLAQEKAATAALEMDQPERALGYIKDIGNWRRGRAYADYALYCVENGMTNRVVHYLDLAEQISKVADQDWRRDRIRARISQTYYLLGQSERAAGFSAGIEPAESVNIKQVCAAQCTDADFADQMDQLRGWIDTGDFGQVKSALYVCIKLYDRFYGDPVRRDLLEEKIKAGWKTLPYLIRIELLMELAEVCLNQNDPAHGLLHVSEAGILIHDTALSVRYRVPLTADLAKLRFRCGEKELAAAELTQARMLFEEKKSDIVNIYKAETLIPVAEAYKTTGDAETARAVYRQAAEAAVENPNSRPRAEDLSAICLSMALHEVEPDQALGLRIHELKEGLGDPW